MVLPDRLSRSGPRPSRVRVASRVVSEAFEVCPDDAAGVAEGIRRAASGSAVHLVRDGRAVANIVPAVEAASTSRSDGDSELDAPALAELEARLAHELPECAAAGDYHAARFGAPTITHYRAGYAQAGAPWPGEAFVRRHYPVADS